MVYRSTKENCHLAKNIWASPQRKKPKAIESITKWLSSNSRNRGTVVCAELPQRVTHGMNLGFLTIKKLGINWLTTRYLVVEPPPEKIPCRQWAYFGRGLCWEISLNKKVGYSLRGTTNYLDSILGVKCQKYASNSHFLCELGRDRLNC